jgi:transcriptional regulator NrdR family protein
MYCPSCRNSRTKVVRSIAIEEYPKPYVIRQRECLGCGDRITTAEKICTDKTEEGDKQ